MWGFAELCRGSFFEDVCILQWKCTFFYFGDAAPAVQKKLETVKWQNLLGNWKLEDILPSQL